MFNWNSCHPFDMHKMMDSIRREKHPDNLKILGPCMMSNILMVSGIHTNCRLEVIRKMLTLLLLLDQSWKCLNRQQLRPKQKHSNEILSFFYLLVKQFINNLKKSKIYIIKHWFLHLLKIRTFLELTLVFYNVGRLVGSIIIVEIGFILDLIDLIKIYSY